MQCFCKMLAVFSLKKRDSNHPDSFTGLLYFITSHCLINMATVFLGNLVYMDLSVGMVVCDKQVYAGKDLRLLQCQSHTTYQHYIILQVSPPLLPRFLAFLFTIVPLDPQRPSVIHLVYTRVEIN